MPDVIKVKDLQGTTIVVDGKDYPIDRTWTDAQVDQYAGSIKASNLAAAQQGTQPQKTAPQQVTPTKAAPKPPRPTAGFFDTTLDLLQQGGAEFSGMINGIEAGTSALTSKGGSLSKAGEAFTKASEDAKGSVNDLFGTKGYTSGNNVLDSAVKAVADPTLGIGAGAKVAATAAKAVAPVMKSMFAGFLGGGGAEAGRDLVETIGGGTAAQLGGAVAGGVGANLGPGALMTRALPAMASKIPSLVEMAVNKFGPMVGYKVPGGARAAADAHVASRAGETVNAKLDLAGVEDPAMAATLAERTAQNRQMGITDPLPSQVMQSNVSMSGMERQAAGNPKFIQSFNERRTQGMDSTRAAAERTFGSVGEAQGALSSTASRAAEAAPAVEARLAKLVDERKTLSEQFMRSGTTSQTEIGTKLRALDESTKKAAKEQRSIEYNSALGEADSRGVGLMAGSPQADELMTIVKAVRDPAGADIFKSNMKLNAIMRKVDDVAANTPAGQAILNPSELDALKQGVNQAVKDAVEPSHRRYAQQIQEMVRGSSDGSVPGLLDKVDPVFGAAIKNADDAYRKTVSGPFGSAEAVKLSRAEFMADVTTRVLSKDEVALGYMSRNDAVGDNAKSLVRSALLHDLETKSKGELTPRVFDNWKLRNKAAIEGSGLSKDVETFGSAQAASMKSELDLSEQFQRNIRDDILAGKVDGKVVTKEIDPVQFTEGLRRDPRKLATYMRQYPGADGIKAVQSLYVESVLSSATPTKTLVEDLRKNPQLRTLMGPTLDKAQVLAKNMEEFSQSLKTNIDPQKLRPVDALDKTAGFSVPQFFAKVAERIGATTTKVLALARMGSARRTEREVTEELGLLLLSNDRIIAASKALAEARKAPAAEVEGHMKNVVDIAKGGAKGALQEGLSTVKQIGIQGGAQGTKAVLREQGTYEENQNDMSANRKRLAAEVQQ